MHFNSVILHHNRPPDLANLFHSFVMRKILEISNSCLCILSIWACRFYIIGFRFDWLIGFLSINAPTPNHSLTHSHTSHNLRPHSQSLYDWLIINWPFSLPLLLLPGDDFGIGNEGNRKLNFVNASHYRLLFWHQVLLFVALSVLFQYLILAENPLNSLFSLTHNDQRSFPIDLLHIKQFALSCQFFPVFS